jgi:hypothetical protein
MLSIIRSPPTILYLPYEKESILATETQSEITAHPTSESVLTIRAVDDSADALKGRVPDGAPVKEGSDSNRSSTPQALPVLPPLEAPSSPLQNAGPSLPPESDSGESESVSHDTHINSALPGEDIRVHESAHVLPQVQAADDPSLLPCEGQCGTHTRRRCSRCNLTPFCSLVCQRRSWSAHHTSYSSQPELGSRSASATSNLELACMENRLPSDDQTLHSYFFDRFATFSEQFNILGVYMELIMKFGVDTEDMEKWLKEDRVVEGIEGTYISRQKVSPYFRWFEQNHDLLRDRAPIVDDSVRFNNGWRAVLNRLGAADRITLGHEDTWSQAQRVCIELWSIILQGFIPGRGMISRREFGFDACINTREENDLGIQYRQLVGVDEKFLRWHDNSDDEMGRFKGRCGFAEFLEAYESGRLSLLMKEKGIYPLDNVELFLLNRVPLLPEGPSIP